MPSRTDLPAPHNFGEGSINFSFRIPLAGIRKLTGTGRSNLCYLTMTIIYHFQWIRILSLVHEVRFLILQAGFETYMSRFLLIFIRRNDITGLFFSWSIN